MYPEIKTIQSSNLQIAKSKKFVFLEEELTTMKMKSLNVS